MTLPRTSESRSGEYERAGYFTAVLLLVTFVGDGWTGRPSPLKHQLLILPITVLFIGSIIKLLRATPTYACSLWTPQRALFLTLLFELLFVPLYLYECRHFVAFGYELHTPLACILLAPAILLLSVAAFRRTPPIIVLLASVLAYTSGLLLSIESFPLNYLRSDMLAVIFWADRSILLHLDPYTTLHVANRLYDFPYLPGMMIAFYPFAALGLDIRFGNIVYLVATACLIYWATTRTPIHDRRLEVSSLLAIFLLCPFLQYRHELYLQPHWFTLILVFVLMQRRHFAYAAFIFGVSMATYQFSWILFPFFLLNALRRRGWLEALKLTLLGAAGALLIVGPFLKSASQRIASNTVGQWGLLPHAMADPINLSYWITYFIHPDKLLRLQAALMVAIFLYCFASSRCTDLADTLRWMIIALTTFILCNVIVDGYFYLMLLVPMLAYTCIANGWWSDPTDHTSAAIPTALS